MIAILRSQGVNCFHPFARQDIDRSSQLAGLVLDKKKPYMQYFPERSQAIASYFDIFKLFYCLFLYKSRTQLAGLVLDKKKPYMQYFPQRSQAIASYFDILKLFYCLFLYESRTVIPFRRWPWRLRIARRDLDIAAPNAFPRQTFAVAASVSLRPGVHLSH